MTIGRLMMVAFLMVATGVVWAGATTEPATKRVFIDRPATTRTTAPATTTVTEKPMAAVALFDLRQLPSERPAGFRLFKEQQETLQATVAGMYQSAGDSSLKGVLVIFGTGDLSLAHAQEIRDALAGIVTAGKRVFAYADSYDTATYLAASGASDICVMDGGQLILPGVSLEAVFARGLLDRIGIQADFVQIGEYKGADEQLTRTSPSPQLRNELNKIADGVFSQIIDGIAARRTLSRQQVEWAVNQAILDGRWAKNSGLVDHLVDMEGLRELLAEELGGKVDLLHDYGMEDEPEMDLSSPFAFFSLLSRRSPVSHSPSVGIVHVDGVIVDGGSDDGPFGDGGSAGGDDLRRAMRIAQRDSSIKAVVLRINSPGGSALASEAIWQAVRKTAAQKPVIVSIGGMAASGGYYVASAGDYIFADRAAMVGSIGVVGGKLVVKDLYNLIGLSSESISRGQNAQLFSSTQPFTPDQRDMLTRSMKQTYDRFVERVMAGRKDKIADIDQVARGRIFLAEQALSLGMVDELGGITQAIRYAAGKVSLKEGSYEVRVIPAPKTLADMLSGRGEQALSAIPSATGNIPGISFLPPDLRQAFIQQMHIAKVSRRFPVMTVFPYWVQIR